MMSVISSGRAPRRSAKKGTSGMTMPKPDEIDEYHREQGGEGKARHRRGIHETGEFIILL